MKNDEIEKMTDEASKRKMTEEGENEQGSTLDQTRRMTKRGRE